MGSLTSSIWSLVALALVAGVYALPLLSLESSPDLSAQEIEGWFFDPEEPPLLVVLAVSTWLVWQRRAKLSALPHSSSLIGIPLLIAGIAAAAWGQSNGAFDGYVWSLAMNTLAFGALARGRPGMRTLALPALVLLFAVPLPDPLENELLWALQKITATGALHLHQLAGIGTLGSDAMLFRDTSAFVVIEECSGLQGILTLTLVSLLLRDLFGSAAARTWLVVAAAPVVACAVNVARVAWIALGDAREPQVNHIGQGISTLLVGTFILFALARGLGRHDAPKAQPLASHGGWPIRRACAVLLSMLCLNMWTPPRAPATIESIDLRRAFADHRGWVGQSEETDRLFIGRVAIGAVIQRQFTRTRHDNSAAEAVQLFVGYARVGFERESPFSSKLTLPGGDWSMIERRLETNWRLFREVETGLARRGNELALVQSWNIGDEGLLRETLRSVFALTPPAFPRITPRRVVRIAAPIFADTPKGHQHAKRSLHRFLIDYGDELESLAEPRDAS